MPDRSKAYAEAGVNLKAADDLVGRLKSIVAETHIKGVLSDVGGFGGLFKPDLAGLKEPVLVSSTDGVGTKVKLASQWNRHETIGIDLVAMSANDVLVQGAVPLFFLDYLATGRLDVGAAATVVAGVAQGCKLAGCALLGGETAEMPDMYADGDYDLAGFCVGLADNDKIVDGSSIRNGDVLIGLASSGVHSNGYSLVRKLAAQANLDPDAPFPWPKGYMGKEEKVWEVLLEPTAIYVKAVKNIMRDFEVRGMVHVTGGGFYDNIPRVLPESVEARIDFGSWTVPGVFAWLKETGDLSWPEMLQIFNCGIGYILMVDPEQAEDILDRLNTNLEQPAWNIGVLAPREDPDSEQVKITISGGVC